MKVVGIVLVVLLLAVYVGALRTIVRAPFRALGVLVAGMAFHNFLLMVLLQLDTPRVLVRALQSWKEGIILLLLILAVRLGLRARRDGRFPRLQVIDWLALAFAAVALLYFVLPGQVLGNHANLSQRLIGLRVALLLPLLYLFGRVFVSNRRDDLAWVAGLIVGSAAIVGLFGLVELWFVPTIRWIDWGVNLLSAWLGFAYHGPGGLPENFFQTTAEGLLLRRMVSTYVSPLGIAYTGLLVVPVAIALLDRRRPLSKLPSWFPIAAIVLTLAGVLFSVTRLALIMLVIEFVAFYLFTRRKWLLPGTIAVAGMVALIIYGYPHFGPLVTRNLVTVAQRPTSLHIATQSDPSSGEHLATLLQDVDFVRHHLLGAGLGSSVHRFGSSQGTGESAIFDMFGDLGIVGGLLYLALYGLGLLRGLVAYVRARREPLLAALPLAAAIGGAALIPITLTSDVWSDFSVTFLFWWAIGYSVTIAAGSATSRLGWRGPGGSSPRGLPEPDPLVV